MNTNACARCERALDFWTDGNGRLIAIHPVTPCVPRKQERSFVIAECCVCGEEVLGVKRFRGTKLLFCSPVCREARRQKKLEARRARQKQEYRNRHPIVTEETKRQDDEWWNARKRAA